MDTQSECPHCGWTPAEQDKLSNDRAAFLAALRAIAGDEAHPNAYPRYARTMRAIARAAIARVEGHT